MPEVHPSHHGKVEKNGAVIVNVAPANKTAVGTGRFAGKDRRWLVERAGNGICSGIWQPSAQLIKNLRTVSSLATVKTATVKSAQSSLQQL